MNNIDITSAETKSDHIQRKQDGLLLLATQVCSKEQGKTYRKDIVEFKNTRLAWI
jgi:hypothetical protein